jgi:RimJ/RimL family protein N-acetyltransferase
METPNLTLVPCTADEVLTRVERMLPEQRAEVSLDWLTRVRDKADVWTLGFSIVHRDTGHVIGTCGFKGPPSLDGIVEIAYGVSPNEQGKGYATEAANALVRYAIDSGQVRLVIAHTLVHNKPSQRVLIKCGFDCVGEVMDPEDGLVLRWIKTI